MLKRVSKAVACVLVCAISFAQEPATSQAAGPSKDEATTLPAQPKDDARDARRAQESHRRALRLQRDANLEEAMGAALESYVLAPNEALYATTAEFIKQQLINQHIDKGNALLIAGKNEEALDHFRQALALDPSNAYAQQRMRDAGGTPPPRLRVASQASLAVPAELQPKPGTQKISVRGNARQVIETAAKAFGLSVIFDESFTSRQARLEIEGDFATVMRAAQLVTKSFYMPLAHDQMLVAADTPDARRRVERMSTRTFFLTNATSPQELADMQNMLRVMFDLRFITANQTTNALVVRAPAEVLDVAQQLIENVSGGPPEIILEIHALQLSDSFSRQLGVKLPLQFTIFNLPSEAASLANQPGLGDLINQIAQTGNISPSDAAAIAALLAAQQSPNSPLLRGFATFGGGRTLSGVTLPSLGITASEMKSAARLVQQVTIRAEQGKAATFRVGDRIPVLTSLFSPLAANPVLNRAIQNDQAVQPIPSFNYEELGITLKATPTVTASSDVKLDLELQLKSLAGAQLNNVPVISNREFKGAILLKNGETSVIAGSIDSTNIRSVQGLPLLSMLPGLGAAFGVPQKQTTVSQLIFLVTPRVIRTKPNQSLELMLSAN